MEAGGGCQSRLPPSLAQRRLRFKLPPQRPPKRLRQLESVSGRGLLSGAGNSKAWAPAALHYVTLSARLAGTAADAGDDGWHLLYRSEAVRICNSSCNSSCGGYSMFDP